ncbi:unnamed protein product [Dicrocoelium dendriticum]|nr:unnamed protein product [Dicrocoelium dendriticum]
MDGDSFNPFADPSILAQPNQFDDFQPQPLPVSIGSITSASCQTKPGCAKNPAILNDDLVEQSISPDLSVKFSGKAISQDLPFQSSYVSKSQLNRRSALDRGYYDDFETIDWVKDVIRDRCRHRELHINRNSFLGCLLYYWDSGSGWFCVLSVGLITGIIACVIDIGTTWMSDLKEGVCVDAFWFNRDQCCWSSNQTDGVCNQWYTWSRLFMGKNPSSQFPEAYFVGYLLYIFFAVLFAGVCVLLVRVFAPYACGSGIAEIKTILGGFVIRGFLGKWTLLIKSVGMVLGVASGLSLGKEGPMVHMAACVGNIVAYCFPKYGRNEAKKREILSASAAAAVAVAFGAPIGGVLFSLEEASYYFPMKTMFRSFFCAMVSANVLRMLNPYGSDTMIMFSVDYKAQWHVMELFPFALLGLLGGVFGTIFNRANLYVCGLRKSTWLGHYPVREVIIVAAVTALISFPHSYLRMDTSALIQLLVSPCSPYDDMSICDYRVNSSDPTSNILGIHPAGPDMSTAMALLSTGLFLKLVLTVFTIGIKVPTGLFIPSLAIGAIMGRMLGVAVEQLVVANASHPFVAKMCKSSQPCISPGLYAMVGAAAALGGVTRMTISLVVMMLELTGGLNYIIPLMVATMISKWIGDRLTNGSIYEEHIRLNGYPFLGGQDELEHMWIAADIMQPSDPHAPLFALIRDGMTMGDLETLLANSTVKGFPVVVSQHSPHLVGWVTRRDLRWAIDRQCQLDSALSKDSPVCFTPCTSSGHIGDPDFTPLNLHNVVDLSPTTVTDQTPLETVLDFFRKLGLRQILVTYNGCLLGIITKKDLIRHLLRYSQKV